MGLLFENEYQQDYTLSVDNAQSVDTDLALKFFVVPTGWQMRIVEARYVAPAGLAVHSSNFCVFSVKKGSTIMAKWSTETGQEGTIAADTFVKLTNSATPANLVAAGGDVLTFSLDESGTTTIPAGKLYVILRRVA